MPIRMNMFRTPAIGLATSAVLLLLWSPAHAQSGPPPPEQDIMYVLPHWFGFLTESDQRVAEEVGKLRARIGEGRYVRVGFSFYLPISMTQWNVDPTDHQAVRLALTDTIATLDTAIARARAAGIPIGIGVFTALRSEVDPSQTASQAEDRRNMQWYSDNVLATGWWTYSRYARKQSLVQEAYVREMGRVLANRIALYPDTVVALSGDGEIELSYDRAPGIGAPGSGDPVLADFSPFAVAEFRDWLRHAGLYAPAEAFAGEGYDLGARYRGDASPAEDTNGDGHTLNGDVGTSFTTWNLRYFDWSLTDAVGTDPNAIPAATYEAPGWNPMPGGADNGFDAPRVRTPTDPWVKVWRLFREQMIWRHNQRFAKWMTSVDEGTSATVPPARWYSYQIPADYLFGTTPDNPSVRLETSASPWWTADVAPYGSLGITSFTLVFPGGIVAPTLAGVAPRIAERHKRWGLLEWHPCLRFDSSVPDDANVCRAEMNLIAQQRPSVLEPFAWGLPSWPVEDTAFETTLRELVDRVKDGYSPNPLLTIDTPVEGAVVTGPITIAGWALDAANAGAGRSTGIDAIHVWAYPEAPGQAAVFLGEATYHVTRPDLGAVFGAEYSPSGFHLTAGVLPSGRYRLFVFARTTVTGTFLIARSVGVTVSGPVSNPALALDSPSNNGTSGQTVTIAGWAIDRGTPSGTGVDTVHVWAFPSGGGSPTFLGAATYGLSRPDIGTALGSQFTNSGFRLAVVVPAGNYTINAYAHSTVANAFNAAVGAVNVTVNTTDSNAVVFVDTPAQNAVVSPTFTISGWAVDSGEPTGTGIDAVHVWAFPTNGAPSFFVGVASYGSARPDIGALYGDSRFTNSGLSLPVNNGNVPSPGTYDFYVFGHSIVTGGFTVARIVRVTVQ